MPISPPADVFGVDGIIILVVVVLVLFGSTQIPKLARSLGFSISHIPRADNSEANSLANIAVRKR